MSYFAEFTDTFGGEPNYCWVRRAVVSPKKDTKRAVLRAARRALGLSGVKGDIVANFGDEYHWKPRRSCTVLMVRCDEYACEQFAQNAQV